MTWALHETNAESDGGTGVARARTVVGRERGREDEEATKAWIEMEVTSQDDEKDEQIEPGTKETKPLEYRQRLECEHTRKHARAHAAEEEQIS